MKNKEITGIYQIVNKYDGKRYIGSSKNLYKRKKDHFKLLRKNKHHGIKFQYAYNKHGENAFYFQILFCCNIKDLIYFEQLELDLYNEEEIYNTCKIAGSTLGIKHSEKANKEKSKRQKGHKISEETKEKIRKSLIGKKHTPERKRNLSLSHKDKMMGWEHPRIKPVIQINPEDNFIIKLWVSASEVEKKLNIKSINIRKVCHNHYGRKTAGGYKWRFATQEEIEKYKKENGIK